MILQLCKTHLTNPGGDFNADVPESIENQDQNSKTIKTSFQWTRIDNNVNKFVSTRENGPNWKDVTQRITYNLDNNEVIQTLEHPQSIPTAELFKKLPEGVTNIKTVLTYRAQKEIETKTQKTKLINP